MTRLVIATHNAKKAQEMVTILGLALPNLEIKTLADYPQVPEPEETGSTYQENAILKAVHAANLIKEWCVADDAGLEIDALPGELGPLSKRFEGENTSFNQKMAIILDRMKGVPLENRAARFVCWVALCSPQGHYETFEGRCEGQIAFEPKGTNGFGYDPIFWLPESLRTMAQLTPEEKHQMSHRGQVLGKLVARLRS